MDSCVDAGATITVLAESNVGGLDLSRLRQVVFENEAAPYFVCDSTLHPSHLPEPALVAEFLIGLHGSSEFTRPVKMLDRRNWNFDGCLLGFRLRLSATPTISTGLSQPQHSGAARIPDCTGAKGSALDASRSTFGFTVLEDGSFVPDQSPSR